MKTVIMGASLVIASVLPAAASSFTIDSSNCTSGGGCYGLAWTLDVTSGSFAFDGHDYGYEALLKVADDPLVSDPSSFAISAVDFKVSTGISDVALFEAPTSLGSWATGIANLNGHGCAISGNNDDFVCSQSASHPANSTAALEWGWYFDSAALFNDFDGAHIGAKMTDLSTPGRLLSASYDAPAPVPEPASLTLLATGLVAAFGARRRRRASGSPARSAD